MFIVTEYAALKLELPNSDKVTHKRVNEYDQEVPQLHTSDQSMAP